VKVLIIAHNYYSFGGAESVLRNLVKNISRRNVVLYLLTDSVNTSNKDNNFAKIYYIPLRTIPIINASKFLMRTFRLLRNILKEERFDLVHVHGNIAKPPKNIPSLMTIHGTYKNELPYLLKHPTSPFYKLIYSSIVYSQYLYEKHTYRFAKYYHTVSTISKEEIVEVGGINPENIFVIPNGVDINKFKPKNTRDKVISNLNLPENVRIVLFVGSIQPRKGVHVLIKSVPPILKKHNVFLLIVGGHPRFGGSYLNYLNELVNRLRISEHVMFLGKVSDEMLIDLYNACDLVVLPSYHEGFGLPILEAAACGKTSVITHACGAKDVLGEFGYYVKPDDHEELAIRIIKALDEIGPYNDKLRKRVEKNYTWDKIAERMVKLYEWCVERG